MKLINDQLMNSLLGVNDKKTNEFSPSAILLSSAILARFVAAFPDRRLHGHLGVVVPRP